MDHRKCRYANFSGAPRYRLSGAALQCTEFWANRGCIELGNFNALQSYNRLYYTILLHRAKISLATLSMVQTVCLSTYIPILVFAC